MNLGLPKRMRHSNDGPAKPTAFPVPDAIHDHTRNHVNSGDPVDTANRRRTGDHVRARPVPSSRQPATTTVHPPPVHPSSESVPPVQPMIIVGSGIPDPPHRRGTIAVPTPAGQFR